MKALMEDLAARKKLFDETPPEEVKYWFEYTGPLQVSYNNIVTHFVHQHWLDLICLHLPWCIVIFWDTQCYIHHKINETTDNLVMKHCC